MYIAICPKRASQHQRYEKETARTPHQVFQSLILAQTFFHWNPSPAAENCWSS